MIDLLQQLIDRAKNEPPPNELLDFCGAYYEPYYHFLYLAGRLMSGYLVELGCEKGRGLLAMALTGKDVIGFDLNRETELDLSQYPNVTFFKESSLPVHPFLRGKKIRVLHIDTEHSYAQASNEFGQFREYLASPAIVVFDDLYARDNDVLKFFDELPFDKVHDDEMHPVCGWGAIWYE